VAKTSFMPTRLIYVGSDVPRLVLSKNIKQPERYATLSHCWGASRHLTLSEGNIDTFQKQIPLGALPRTFLEAVQATRSVQLDYLWIDSLCIIQDKDGIDWAEESSKMTQVYGSSTVRTFVRNLSQIWRKHSPAKKAAIVLPIHRSSSYVW
jgi:hypothetical protein